MTALENLDIPLEYPAHERSDAADADAMEILRAIGLESKAHLRPAGLTQIEMRKLELARAMAARPGRQPPDPGAGRARATSCDGRARAPGARSPDGARAAPHGPARIRRT
jgi:hypothetical protein